MPLVLQVTTHETNLVARCRRVYAHAHDYHINSISNNRFGVFNWNPKFFLQVYSVELLESLIEHFVFGNLMSLETIHAKLVSAFCYLILFVPCIN